MSTATEQSDRTIRDAGIRLFVAGCVCASFLAYSAAQAPVPGPNEPHYLCKAKHYWDDDYCPNDIFLDSSNAHLVFYQTVGPLTLFLTLEETGFVARGLGYALLAFGWTLLISRMTRSRFAPLWAAWVFLAIVSIGNLSGEWIVGGIESKVFTYGFLFWGLANLLIRRWISGGLLLGLAVSYHPVVGVWGAIAAAMMVAVMHLIPRFQKTSDDESPSSFRQMVIAAVVFAAASAPGLVPAMALVMESDDVDTATANRLQVFVRLGHHLDPMRMKKIDVGEYEIEAAWLAYALMFVFWLSLRSRLHQSPTERRFAWFVIASTVIAIGGVIVGWMPRDEDGIPLDDVPFLDLRITLMKFYAFRLFDVILPIAAAVTLVRGIEQATSCSRELSTLRRVCAALQQPGIYIGFIVFALLHPIIDRNPSHMKPDELADWKRACEWAKNNLPADAQVLTPSSSWAFKWYAERAEYVSYKDCPQEAAGLLEWRRRQVFFADWGENQFTPNRGYSNAAVRQLVEQEGITHLVCYSYIELFELTPIFPEDPNDKSQFRIYRLTDALPKK